MLLLSVNVHYPLSHYLVKDNKGKCKMPFFSLLVVTKPRANL